MNRSLRVAASGARVLLLSDHDPGHVNIVQRPLASFADTSVEYPLQPFDIILCQRMLSSLRYAEARAMVRCSLGRPGSAASCSSPATASIPISASTTPTGKLVGERFVEIAPDLAGRHGISGPSAFTPSATCSCC